MVFIDLTSASVYEFLISRNGLFAIWKQYLPFSAFPNKVEWEKGGTSGRILQIERKHSFWRKLRKFYEMSPSAICSTLTLVVTGVSMPQFLVKFQENIIKRHDQTLSNIIKYYQKALSTIWTTMVPMSKSLTVASPEEDLAVTEMLPKYTLCTTQARNYFSGKFH